MVQNGHPRRRAMSGRITVALALAALLAVWAILVLLPQKDEHSLARAEHAFQVAVNEGSSAFLVATFKDQNGQPVIPNSVNWYVYDRATGTILQPPQDVDTGALSSTLTLEIKPEGNQIVNVALASEQHGVPVAFSYGGPTATPVPGGVPTYTPGQIEGPFKGSDEAVYSVRNIPGLVVVCDANGCRPTPIPPTPTPTPIP